LTRMSLVPFGGQILPGRTCRDALTRMSFCRDGKPSSSSSFRVHLVETTSNDPDSGLKVEGFVVCACVFVWDSGLRVEGRDNLACRSPLAWFTWLITQGSIENLKNHLWLGLRLRTPVDEQGASTSTTSTPPFLVFSSYHSSLTQAKRCQDSGRVLHAKGSRYIAYIYTLMHSIS